MPVKSAEEAIDIGMAFIKKSYAYAWPIKATKEGDYWHVEIDIGIFQKKIAEIIIDASSGEITKFTVRE